MVAAGDGVETDDFPVDGSTHLDVVRKVGRRRRRRRTPFTREDRGVAVGADARRGADDAVARRAELPPLAEDAGASTIA